MVEWILGVYSATCNSLLVKIDRALFRRNHEQTFGYYDPTIGTLTFPRKKIADPPKIDQLVSFLLTIALMNTTLLDIFAPLPPPAPIALRLPEVALGSGETVQEAKYPLVWMSKRLRYCLLLAVLLGVLLNPLCAQSPSYHRYTTADGLPTNYVYGVVEGAEGYIWAYTENGLAKFDGYTFEHFTTADGLPGNDITWAVRAPDNKIWLYTYKNRPAYLLNDSIHIVDDEPAILSSLLPDGSPLYSSRGNAYTYDDKWKCLNLYYVSPQEFKRFGHKWQAIQSYPNTPALLQKLEQQEHNIYTKTEDSITTWDMSKDPLIKYPRSLSRFFYHFNDSLHWQFNQQWLTVPLGKSTRSTLRWPIPGQAEKWIYYLHASDQHLFLDTSDGIGQYFSLTDFGLKPRPYNNISTQDSAFWILSDKGNTQLNYAGQLLKKLSWTKEEQAWTPLRTYTDRAGNIWQGTRNGGLLMIPFAYQAIHKRNLPPSGNQYLKRLLKTPDDQVLGITENGEVYDIGADTIRSIYQAKQGTNFRTAAWLDQQLFLSLSGVSLLLTLQADTIKAQVFQAVFNCSWIGTHLFPTNFTSSTYLPQKKQFFGIPAAHQIYRWDLAPSANEQCRLSLLTDKASVIYAHLTSSTIYGGSINGLSIMKNDRFQPFLRQEDRLKNISALFGTPGKLWIGTESNGLFCYHFGTKTLEQVQVLDDVFIKAIRPDDGRGILAVTNKGVFVVPSNEPGNSRRYTPLGGLSSFEIKDVLALGDSVLLVASSHGLYELQRNTPSLSPQAHNSFQLKAIYANETPIQAAELAELSYTTKQLDFNFHLRSYASKGDIQYQTRLDPLESNWHQSKERSRRYTSLRPGAYQFHVAAIDIYGRSISLPTIDIYIRPAIWQRVWLQALLIVSLFVSIIIMGRNRLQVAKQKLAAEQALNRRLAVMELEALKAQMNPHFIFNALGSIQYFIQTQEVELADDYLTRFARLMRQYLDSSRETLLPLEQEIALLTNYTELEQMRFEKLFQVELKIADELTISDFQIPTMMTQPFVENAINHGLSERRDGKGYLSIHFSQMAPDTLCCTIRDNGIGRKRAALRDRAGHRSRGIQIVQEKMETLAAADLVEVNYTITDANPNEEGFSGTLVTLIFKFPDDANT